MLKLTHILFFMLLQRVLCQSKYEEIISHLDNPYSKTLKPILLMHIQVLSDECNITSNHAPEYNDPEVVLLLLEICDLNENEVSQLGRAFAWRMHKELQAGEVIYQFDYDQESCPLYPEPEILQGIRVEVNFRLSKNKYHKIDWSSVEHESYQKLFYLEYKSKKMLSDDEHQILKEKFTDLSERSERSLRTPKDYHMDHLISKATILAKGMLYREPNVNVFDMIPAYQAVHDLGWHMIYIPNTDKRKLWNYKFGGPIFKHNSLLDEWRLLLNRILGWKRRSWSYVYNC